jgi:hypothetical protein
LTSGVAPPQSRRLALLLADHRDIRFSFLAGHVDILADFGDGRLCRHRLCFNDGALLVGTTNDPEAFVSKGGSRTSYDEGSGQGASQYMDYS